MVTPGAVGDPATPTTAFLGFTWNGGNGATLAGQGLATRFGVVEVTAAGTYRLRVDGANVADAVVTASNGLTSCRPTATNLCLNQGRFDVRLDFATFNGTRGAARVADPGTEDSGLLFFFNPNNWEMLVKVLDNCNGSTNRFWVLAAATTNLEYTLTVTDTAAGVSKTYFNPLGTSAPAIVDTRAFDTCAVGNAATATPASLAPAPRLEARRSQVAPGKGTTCTADDTSFCLQDDRFHVEVEFAAQNGNSGLGRVAPAETADSGVFFFFNPNNWEMLVKVLDNCNGATNRFWVFAAATTNVEFTLRVTDTQTGQVVEYDNPLGNRANAVTDTNAFATCP